MPATPDTALLTENVTVNTLNATGVVPRTYAPPGYAHSIEGNYNNVAGYLENGNQRYVNLLTVLNAPSTPSGSITMEVSPEQKFALLYLPPTHVIDQ